ncbi:MAG: hypothetical protein J6Q54_08555 [Oscillospiraceae bacterium]|nr:hypothetical protein [Oscillospiraceae bacterium]
MNDTMELNIKEIAKAVWKRFWIVVLCAALSMFATVFYTANFVTPTYKASVTMYVNNNTSGSDTVSSANLAVAMQLANTYVRIIQSESVLEKVLEEAKISNLTTEDVRSMLTAEVVDETEIFRVSVVTPHPGMSADIANAIANIAPEEISNIIEGSKAKIIDYAKVPTSKYAPNITSSGILGGLIGGLLSCLVLVVIQITDQRIKSEEELQAIYNIPVLGAIPDFVETARISEKAKKNERRKAK